MMKTKIVTLSKSDEYIVSQRNFRASNLWGLNLNDSKYIIYSYNTPISAWISGKGWVVVKEKISRTTTTHIKKVCLALGKYNEVSRDELNSLLSA